MSVTSEAYTDVVELCALLQCLGFCVKSFEADLDNTGPGGNKTVVINCPTSGLHVVLEGSNTACSCPATEQQQNSGVWEVSGVAGGKQLDKEFGCNILCSLPKEHRNRLSKELHQIIKCIKQVNETDGERLSQDDKSASMSDIQTPNDVISNLKLDTPGRYRSLDTLTAAKGDQDIPTPGSLRQHLVSESSVDDQIKSENKQTMCRRQSTYTVSSTPDSIRLRNKTSSPIHSQQNTILESLKAAEKAADDLKNKLASVIREFFDDGKNDSSMSSLALDVSKISVLKGPEPSRSQFASSPNLSGIMASDDFTTARLKRFDSASTSNLCAKPASEGKASRFLGRISPKLFKTKSDVPNIKINKVKGQDGKSKLNSLFRPKIVTPIRTKGNVSADPSPNLSASTKKKFSHVKSTIPRLSKKE